MDRLHIEKIIEQNAFPDIAGESRLVETHISWVILSQNFAFKIKKPLCYSFLDFSTLEKRKFFCERELELNQRLTEDMYLAVAPIRKGDNFVRIGGPSGKVIDYAVKMRRMDESRQMNKVLEEETITLNHMEQLADRLASFHMNTDVVEKQPDITAMQEDFADLLKINHFVKEHLGQHAAEKIEETIAFSDQFLKKHSARILERHARGFTIDGHGDLHSKNIFLMEKPIVFDCIEFNDHFRQLDVLNELAFLCMDLDFYGRKDLGDHFLQKYFLQNPCLVGEEDRHIFNYYKLYRSNIKVKVNALKSMQTCNEQEFQKRKKLMTCYFNLLNKYLSELLAIPAVMS